MFLLARLRRRQLEDDDSATRRLRVPRGPALSLLRLLGGCHDVHGKRRKRVDPLARSQRRRWRVRLRDALAFALKVFDLLHATDELSGSRDLLANCGWGHSVGSLDAER